MEDFAPPATLPKQSDVVRIVHCAVPGRVRLHVRGLRHAPVVQARLKRGLARWGEVRGAWPSLQTGNLLLLFDASLSPDAVARRVAEIAGAPDTQAEDTEPAWHAMPTPVVAAELGSSAARGLRAELAERRLALNGPNRVAPPVGRSAFEILRGQFESLPMLLLIGAAAVSVFTGGVADALAILCVVALNGGIGFTVESRAEKTIRSLQGPPLPPATVVRNGQRREVPAEALVPGDLLLVARGTTVPADARVLEAQDLHCDEALLTGESLPVRKSADTLPGRDHALADRTNMLYRGTLMTSGTGKAIVVATGVQTEIGRLHRILGETTRPPTPMEQELEALGRRLTWLSLALGAAVAVVGLMRGFAFGRMLRSSVALAIAAIPEGLPVVASTTLARGVETMRRRGVLVRRLDAMETLGAVQVLCFDKTGTLTFNRMSVAAVAPGNAEQEFIPDELPGNDETLQRLLEIAVLCSEVEIGADGNLCGSETEVALVRLAQSAGIEVRKLRDERPRTGVRQRTESYRFMATTHALPDGSTLTAVKGDPIDVLKLCDSHLDAKQITDANNKMAARALRVLGFAFRIDADTAPTHLENLNWLGLVGLADALRPSAAPLMQRLKQAGIHPVVLTGDQLTTGQAIAHRLNLNGLESPLVFDSAALTAMAPHEVAAAAREAHVFARVSPAGKLQIVQALQRAGAIVGMVGDGFNDSPALKAANVGISIGGAGAEAARSAADLVMQTDDLGAIAVAIEQGRAAHANVRRATGYLVGTNASEMAFVLAGTAIGMQEPLSAAQLLWINIVTDVFPCIGLASEPPDAHAMHRPPRSREDTILSAADFPRLAGEGALLAAGALTSAACGAGAAAQTMGFGSLALGQLLHALNRRESAASTSNPLFWRMLTLACAAQALGWFVPGLRGLLGVAPLGAAELGITIAGGVGPFVANRLLWTDQSAAARSMAEGACSANRSFIRSSCTSAARSLIDSPASAIRSRTIS